MPVFADGLSLAPEIIDALDRIRKFELHWLTYEFTISKQVHDHDFLSAIHPEISALSCAIPDQGYMKAGLMDDFLHINLKDLSLNPRHHHARLSQQLCRTTQISLCSRSIRGG